MNPTSSSGRVSPLRPGKEEYTYVMATITSSNISNLLQQSSHNKANKGSYENMIRNSIYNMTHWGHIHKHPRHGDD